MPGPLGPLIAGLSATAFWTSLRTLLVDLLRKTAAAIPGVVAYGLAAFGLYIFVAEPMSDTAMNWVAQQFNGATGTVLETIYYLNVDNYISAIISAQTAVAAGKVMLKARRMATSPGGTP